MEPVIEQKYDDEIDDPCSSEDAVIIMYNDATDEDSGNLYISHLMAAIDQEINNIPIATQRLGFSDFEQISNERTI